MSFQTISSPRTGIGVILGETLKLSTPQFSIHECGFAPSYQDWTSGDIMSPYWCLWHVLDEGYWLESNGERWDLGPDCLMLAPPQVVYATFNNLPASHVWIHFSLLPEYVFDASAPFEIPMNALLREHIAALIKSYRENDVDRKRTLFHHCAALLNSCLALHPLPLRVLPDNLHRVLLHIENSPSGDLSNAHLAHLANLSVSGFISLFQAHMYQPPAAYVRGMRYQKATRMLVFSDLSIQQIAAKLGYPNRHYFSRVFAEQAGCGPATFRTQSRK